MAPGPLPKLPEQRARQNIPARGEWLDLTPLDKPGLPPLPKLAVGAWNARTARIWNGLRWDPATATFGKAETALAIEWAHLHARGAADGNASMLNTAASLLDKLGLTPKGKRDLRLRVVEAAPLASVVSMAPPPKVERPAE